MENKMETLVGTCKVDITPNLPISLAGQYYNRVAYEVHSELTATVLAVESITNGNADSFIMVSCDLLGIPKRLLTEVRKLVTEKQADIDTDKIIMNAIHTHSAPYIYKDTASSAWGIDFECKPMEGVVDPNTYAAFLAEKIAEAITAAWNARLPAMFHYGYDYLSIAHCRRVVYTDGTAEMYGSTARDDFMCMEGAEDSGIHFMAFYDKTDTLISIMINIPCPSQILEHKSYIASDFWHEIRKRVNERYGKEVTVLALTGAAGDLSPRDLVRMACNEREMYDTPMYNVEGTAQIAEKVTQCLDGYMKLKGKKYETNMELMHQMKILHLPIRTVTRDEVTDAEGNYKKLRSKHENIEDFTEKESMWISIYASIINRYKQQQESPTYPVEVHCIRLGGAIIATNPFELYLDYANKIRSKSGTPNTFIVQLACGYDGYLPTQKAIDKGGYSAYVANGFFGEEGGNEFVFETISMIRATDSSPN